MIQVAPVQIQPIEANSFTTGWLQWFSELGDAIEGEWSADYWQLEASGIDSPSAYFSMSGSSVSCLISWSDEVVTSGASITLPKINGSYLSVLPSMLRIWDTATLKSGVLVEGSTVIIPDGTYANLIIEGTLFPQRIQAGRS